MSHVRGGKPPKLPGMLGLSHYLPDRRRAILADIAARNVYFASSLESDHTSLALNDTQTQTTDELQRVKAVRVGTVTGGTVTVQVQVEGRDIFQDALRPVSGGVEQEPHAEGGYTFPAGPVLSTIIEATSGAPSGTANVVIETEPFALLPKFEPIVLHGKDRLRPSLRHGAEAFNARGQDPESVNLFGRETSMRDRITLLAIRAQEGATSAGSELSPAQVAARSAAKGGPFIPPPKH